MVEAPERAFCARGEFLALRVGQIGKTGRHWLVEVAGAVGLNGDHVGDVKALVERAGKPVGRDGRNSNPPPSGAIIAVDGIGRHTNHDTGKLRVLVDEGLWK